MGPAIECHGADSGDGGGSRRRLEYDAFQRAARGRHQQRQGFSSTMTAISPGSAGGGWLYRKAYPAGTSLRHCRVLLCPSQAGALWMTAHTEALSFVPDAEQLRRARRSSEARRSRDHDACPTRQLRGSATGPGATSTQKISAVPEFRYGNLQDLRRVIWSGGVPLSTGCAGIQRLERTATPGRSGMRYPVSQNDCRTSPAPVHSNRPAINLMSTALQLDQLTSCRMPFPAIRSPIFHLLASGTARH